MENQSVIICIVFGTRPEIIKLFPVIKACDEIYQDYFIVHVRQHYSHEMSGLFLEELSINKPKHTLEVGWGSHGEQTANILEKCEKVLLREKPDVVLIEGDTNTVLGSALAACKIGIKVGHVEAGLRSYDRDMPEEINRVLADHISDYCYAPTKIAAENLRREGIELSKIIVTGNTIVDSLLHNRNVAEEKSDILARNSLSRGKYILLTVHRQENVDNEKKLRNIMDGLKRVQKAFGLNIVCPLHPRTKKKTKEFNIERPKEILFTDPLGYLDFIKLENNAKLIMTDSGGVQEEACILEVPCVTLRENTERPETLEIGANILAGTDPETILESAGIMLNKIIQWENPFGDGKASIRILDSLK
ncbi:MAG: non-hydrolyzing UDP-N-acetylglucosamine 2-epimerase [Candidatus Binatia bacterium]